MRLRWSLVVGVLLRQAAAVQLHGKLPQLTFGEINLVATTDTHSWLTGHAHEPSTNATLGHVLSFVERLRDKSRSLKRDLFFFDNGDVNDGTALSAEAVDRISYIIPILKAVPYDAVNIGNHELYDLTQGLFPGVRCAVVALNDTGYIRSGPSKYLTSNVVWANTTDPVGSRYTVLQGEFGTKLLVFGFLYNFMEHCTQVNVEDVSTVVGSPWFKEALRLHGSTCDAIVVLAHMPYDDPLIDIILAGIRQVMAAIPVQFVAGHSHVRGWRRLDAFASVAEPGCKLNTVGFTSFSPSGINAATISADGASSLELEFRHFNLDGNSAALASAINLTEQQLLTPSGTALLEQIGAVRRSLGADTVIGCSDLGYDAWAGLGQADSLWSLYISRVVPDVLVDTSAGGNDMIALLGRSMLEANLPSGLLLVDDAYVAAPYGSSWLVIRDVAGTVVAEVLLQLNRNGPQTRHARVPDGMAGLWLDLVPAYLNSSAPEPGTRYDLLVSAFDHAIIVQLVQEISGEVAHFESYRREHNSTSVLIEWFREHRPCPTTPELQRSGVNVHSWLEDD